MIKIDLWHFKRRFIKNKTAKYVMAGFRRNNTIKKKLA